MSLRVMATWMVSLMVALALGAIGLLAELADRQERISLDLADAIVAARHVQEVEVAVLTRGPGLRDVPRSEGSAQPELVADTPLNDRIAAMVTEARPSHEGVQIAAEVQQTLARYLEAERAARGTSEGPEIVRLRDAAAASLERLVELDLRQALLARADARRTEHAADVAAVAVSLLLVTLAVAPLVWLWRSALRPVVGLARAMERFSTGERSARAAEIGARETRYIARRFNEMASALERERERQLTFLSSVAHDLRNPLSVLRTSAALGESGKLSPAQASCTLAMVGRQVASLDRMVGDLLDVTRIEAGKLELRLEVRDARTLARDVVEVNRTSEARAFELSLPEHAVPIVCDPTRIEQVLHNLVSNALKYSPSPEPVSVSVSRQGLHAVFTVEDHGIGIPGADLPLIFEPFRRSASASRVASGAGLGLSVARRIVRAHGGSIEVRSTPGKGSVFDVRIPLATASAAG